MFLLDTNTVTGNRTDFEATGVAFVDPWGES